MDNFVIILVIGFVLSVVLVLVGVVMFLRGNQSQEETDLQRALPTRLASALLRRHTRQRACLRPGGEAGLPRWRACCAIRRR
jgi:hypothetical protein